MDEILQLGKSPAFWFSSVVIAFLMSLFASYVKDWVEVIKINVSKKRQIKKEIDELSFIEKVSELTRNPTLLSLYMSDIVFQKVRNVLYLLVSYVMMCFALYGALNSNFKAALIFGASSLLMFAIPAKITDSKVTKMSRLVNAAIKEDKHFLQ